MTNYSNKLIKDYQVYMKNRCEADIPDEDADLHLDSLADLFSCLSKMIKGNETNNKRTTNSN